MIRRQRRPREAPFSFDSFLDVVANVVGIIIRLILVVWVGARSYTSLQQQETEPSQPAETVRPPDQVAQGLETELSRQRAALQDLQQRLLEQLRLLQGPDKSVAGQARIAELAAQRRQIAGQDLALGKKRVEQDQQVEQVVLSKQELAARNQKLIAEIRDLEKAQSARKVIHFRTPVSRPVQAEEYTFECRNGHVTHVDLSILLEDLKQGLEEMSQQLRTTWQVDGYTRSVKAFRLHYIVERERGLLDSLGNSSTPGETGGFRYGISAWEVQPVAFERGETLESALKPGSEFRDVVDRLDATHAAVTFWVYPDSFEVFRRLRDYLYEKDVVVAGRPLPMQLPIASSRKGSVSRGQ